MNWYTLHYAAVNTVERLAAGLSAQIFDIIKTQVVEKGHTNNYKGMGNMSYRIYPNLKLLEQMLTTDVRNNLLNIYEGMYLHIVFKDRNQAECSGGLYSNKNGTYGLMFQAHIPRDFSYKDFRNFYTNLQMAVRHELEHFVQFIIKNQKEESTSFMKATNTKELWAGLKNYYLNRNEMEAFATGFYYQAKKSKKGFRDILSKYLYSIAGDMIQYNGLPREEVYQFMSELYDKYLNYAQNRYPNLKEQPLVV
jgi:hypothetical protein